MSLTPIERYIIESLSSSNKNLLELLEDLKLEKVYLENSLSKLIQNKLLVIKQDKYFLNIQNLNEIKKLLSHRKSKNYELKSILDSARDRFINTKDGLNISKVYLTKDDLEMTESLLRQLKSFLSQKAIDNKTKNISSKYIFYWGNQTYSDVLNYLNS